MFNLFFNNKDLITKGDVVDLKYRYEVNEKEAYDGIPTVYYSIYLHDTYIKVGEIDLRLKMNDYMYYYGHIGYSILKKYRGHNYSYYACLVAFNICKEKYNMNDIYLTCNPDNIASYKILKKLNGEFIEERDIPEDHELYRLGDRRKYIFRYKI